MPSRAQALQQLEDLVDDDRRQPERRLVEQEQRGPRHQRPADGEHLLLPARERAPVLPHALAQDREEVEHVLVRGVVVGAIARDRAAEPQVVGHREPREHAPPLGRERDPAAHDGLGRELVDRLALEPHQPARDRHEADHGIRAGSTCPRRWRPAGRRSRPAGRSTTRSGRPRWGRSGRRGRRR